jgi:hypothetical protein
MHLWLCGFDLCSILKTRMHTVRSRMHPPPCPLPLPPPPRAHTCYWFEISPWGHHACDLIVVTQHDEYMPLGCCLRCLLLPLPSLTVAFSYRCLLLPLPSLTVAIMYCFKNCRWLAVQYPSSSSFFTTFGYMGEDTDSTPKSPWG